jgi:hypothetical protein
VARGQSEPDRRLASRELNQKRDCNEKGSAKQLHDRAIVVDSHDDTTQQLIVDEAFDIGKRNPNGNIASAAPRCRWVWKTRRNCRRSPTRCLKKGYSEARSDTSSSTNMFAAAVNR